jgi:hypothetical protein
MLALNKRSYVNFTGVCLKKLGEYEGNGGTGRASVAVSLLRRRCSSDPRESNNGDRQAEGCHRYDPEKGIKSTERWYYQNRVSVSSGQLIENLIVVDPVVNRDCDLLL